MKQRLVGAAVIVALMVILVPMFLDGSGQPALQEIPLPPQPERALDEPMNIPEPETELPAAAPTQEAPGGAGSGAAVAPRSPVPQASAPSAPSNPAPAAEPAPASEPEPEPAPASEPEPEPAPEPEAAAEPAPPQAQSEPVPEQEGFVVQVGSFSAREKAQALRERLTGSGFTAFVDPYRDGENAMYRVRVGPVESRDAAETLQGRLEKTAGIGGSYVTSHP